MPRPPPGGQPTLAAFDVDGVGGRPAGGPVEPGRVAGTGLATLAGLLGSDLPELRKRLLRWHQHDWKNDVYSLGSYTYVPRGAIHASDELSVPVEKTLFFGRRT